MYMYICPTRAWRLGAPPLPFCPTHVLHCTALCFILYISLGRVGKCFS